MPECDKVTSVRPNDLNDTIVCSLCFTTCAEDRAVPSYVRDR